MRFTASSTGIRARTADVVFCDGKLQLSVVIGYWAGIGRIGGSVLAVTGLGLGALEVATSDNTNAIACCSGRGLLGAVTGRELGGQVCDKIYPAE
jgi:hypothetical protein